MRKLIYSVLSIAMLSIGSVYAGPPNDPTYQTWTNVSDHAGKQSNPVRRLKLVRYSECTPDGASVASGDALVYDTVSDDGVTVRLTTTSADGAFAGIAVTAISSADSTGQTSAADDIGKRNWGWMIVHGPAIANVTAGGSNGHVAGDLLITSTDAGKVTTMVNRAGTGSALNAELGKVARGNRGFFFDSATAANTTEEVFVIAE